MSFISAFCWFICIQKLKEVKYGKKNMKEVKKIKNKKIYIKEVK